MDLRINSKSHVPVHVQLEGQIKHLILTGGFEVGSRLPSIRSMAGFLRVNRNTVARVFSDLEREGYVESRRGSGVYVVEPPVDVEDIKRQDVLERVMDLAAAQGVSVENLAYGLLARSGAEPQDKLPILFVECTRAELDPFSDELEEQLPVEVEKVLVADLADRVSDAEELPWRLAVTTFFHIHEVQEIGDPGGGRGMGTHVHGEPLELHRGRRSRPPRLRPGLRGSGTGGSPGHTWERQGRGLFQRHGQEAARVRRP